MLEIKNYDSTTEHKKEIMFNLYFSEIKNKDISEINNNLLLKWRNGVHRFVKIGKIKDNRFNRILEIMRSLLDVAKSLNLLKDNQYDSLILNRIKEDKSVSLKLLNNYITQEELKLFVEGIQSLESTFFITIPQNTFIFMVKFLYYTGLRINEARAVKVEDFIIDRRNDSICYLLVNKQMLDNSYGIKKTLKNKNPERKVYLKKEIYKDFTKYFLEYNLKSNDFVFDYIKTGKSITRKIFSDLLTKTIRRLKKDEYLPDSFPYLTPHGFRYSNTLYLKELGVSVKNAAQMQGHSVTVMMNTYARSDKTEINTIFGV